MSVKMSVAKKWEQLDKVEEVAEKTISIRQYCSVMETSDNTHYVLLRENLEYRDAYARGINKRIAKNLKNIEDIADNSSEKAANARLDASKLLMSRGEKMLSNMGKGRYTDGEIKDQLIKIADDYTAGIIDTEFANAILTITMSRAKAYELIELNPLVDAVKKLTEQK